MRMYDDDFMLIEKQHEIMELVYKFRFINRKQIQKIMGYKDAKSVNVLLKELVEHKYLGRNYSKKLLENTKPAIYYLANQGIGWVRINHFEDYPERVKRFYQDKTASERFINHCINLADLYTNWIPFKSSIEKRKEVNKEEANEYFFSTSTEMWFDYEEIKNIRPDAHTERWVKDDIFTYFLELIEDYVPMYAIRYKIDQYIEFVSNTDAWDIFASHDKSIYVRLILPNQQKVRRVGRYVQKRLNDSYDIEKLTFLLATYDDVKNEGLENEKIWKVVKSEF
jgi:hypothetical protein